MTVTPPEPTEIAIVGMACRFPGAATPEQFWQLLKSGLEMIRDFSREEQLAQGISPSLLDDPAWVSRAATLNNIEDFDTGFFGYSPQEAALLDPQNRVFLECVWEALEAAGQATDKPGDIGVFAGAGVNTYFLNHLAGRPELLETFGSFQLMIANDKDYLATLPSYKFNLTGPGVTVQTACSTSLVAVHMACQSLINGECALALAGGVALSVPQETGYLYQEGMIYSPDGHCRPFDAKAAGTVSAPGAGVVLLQPLADALACGANILAIIKGSAINNDGARKVGYTAPGLEGQAKVISEAQQVAGVIPDEVAYVEAHGTATALGDPIEIAAISKAFRRKTQKVGCCAIGSVKSNMGHTGAAAGVAGLIKTVLCLQHGQIVPSLHFENPHPDIDFASSPFYVNTRLLDWPAPRGTRVAGVSSFGIGGTNAHVILADNRFADESPSSSGRSWQLLPLSAQTPAALDQMIRRLADRLVEPADLALADVAHTLQIGRKAFPHRAVVCSRSLEEARLVLASGSSPALLRTEGSLRERRRICFMFTGHGGQSVGMARGIYANEPVFRQTFDRYAEFLRREYQLDLHAIIAPSADTEQSANRQLGAMESSQPLMFMVQMSLARLWQSWGIHPQALIGHSSGEFSAACLAGIFSETDALRILVVRGRLMDRTEPGGMVTLPNSPEEVRPLLTPGLSLAVINAPDLCVVSGAKAELTAFTERLTDLGVDFKLLHVSIAAHSPTMEAIQPDFARALASIKFSEPTIPLVSAKSGNWADASEISRPDYWVRHLRETVNFADGVGKLLEDPDTILLEIGPGNMLGTITQAHPSLRPSHTVLVSLPPPQKTPYEDEATLHQSLGQLWLAGVEVDWRAYAGNGARLVSLPTYPFQRQRCWIDAPSATNATPASALPTRKADHADWFYEPFWQGVPPAIGTLPLSQTLLMFLGAGDLGERLAHHLETEGTSVLRVLPGEAYAQIDAGRFTVRPDSVDDYRSLLGACDGRFSGIVHAWSLIQPAGDLDDAGAAREAVLGCQSLGLLGSTLGTGRTVDAKDIPITVLTCGMDEVSGNETLCPEKHLVSGPVMVIRQEYPSLVTRLIDLVVPSPGSAEEAGLLPQLAAELRSVKRPTTLCLRGRHAWAPHYSPTRIETSTTLKRELRMNGVYLITGGLGGLGLEIAGHLARTVQARLVLVGRRHYPAPGEWDHWIATHPSDDATRQVLERLRTLEAAGASLRLHAADVADAEAMGKLLVSVEQDWGPVCGVIHAAGAINAKTHNSLDEYDPAQWAEQFSSKVAGTRVLRQLFAEKQLDFCILMSSMASVLGGLGFAAYSAANAYLDATAAVMERSDPGRWISINWDSWQVRSMGDRGAGQLLRSLQMSASEGLETFLRVLHHGRAPQLIATTGDLAPRLLQWVELRSNGTPSPAQSGKEPAPDEPAPPSVEEGIRLLWQKFLGHKEIGLDDNFFEIGGQSLMATRVLAQIRQLFGVAVPMRLFFKGPSIRALSTAVENALMTPGDAHHAKPSPSGQEGGVLGLSWAQQRLWVIDRIEPGNSQYNVPFALQISGPLQREALKRSLNEIVRRHAILRTIFPAREGSPVQLIQAPAPQPLPFLSLVGLEKDALEREIRSRLSEEAERPFFLETGPLLRTLLIEAAPERHVLSLVMHHIVTDGWSIALFKNELEVLLGAFSAGKPSPLPEPTLQYADYCRWQETHPGADALAQQRAYWLKQLRGLPEQHALLPDFPTPEERSFHSDSVSIFLSQDIPERLSLFTTAEAATPFMILMAAFHALLQRYTGVDDQALAISIANRTESWQESLQGFFVNTLIMRSSPTPDKSFRTLVDEVRKTALEAYANQDLPFEQVVQALAPRRERNRNPLAQIGFVLQNLPGQGEGGAGVTTEFVESIKHTSQFDLVCSINEVEGGYHLSLEYATELFSRAKAESLARHYRQLLRSALEQPDAPLGRLSFLEAAEREEILVRWSSEMVRPPAGINPLATPDPACRNFVELFGREVRLHPRAIALRFGNQCTDYATLDAVSNRLASALNAEGFVAGTPVCVELPRGPELIIAFLGILKAGLVYVPLDPAAPPARLAAIRAEIRPAHTLTSKSLSALLAQAPSASVPTKPLPELSNDQLAYIIHTSGSSGKPKGVLLTHLGLFNLAMELRRLIAAAPGDRILQMASSGFDASIWEFLMALAGGAELVLAPAEELLPGKELLALLEKQGITHLTITPSALAQLPSARLPALRVLVSAGAALPAALARRWGQDRIFINAYGPTEATVCTTLRPCPPVGQDKPGIGRPLAGWRIFVVDSALNPVPAGVPGELLIGGPNLARGYWEQDALSASSFIENPFPLFAGERVYRSGDRVVFRHSDPKGLPELEFLGRMDAQVKLRGFRIEPGEIEHALQEHPAIRTAVVLGMPEGDPVELAAFLLVQEGKEDAGLTEELRKHLRKTLPDYMIPAHFVVLPQLPLLTNGKIDRQRLPDPRASFIDLTPMAPRDDLERGLCELWEKILGVRGIGVRQDFFAAGGSSLQAVELVAAIDRTFRATLPASALFRHPTIESLAALLRQKERPGLWKPLVPLKTGGLRPPSFWIPGAGASVLSFQRLARHLDADRPVYGLQAAGIDGQGTADASIEVMAERFVHAIQEEQPHGPYFLGGHSFGAKVAYAVAQQLMQQGEEIKLLTVIDGHAPSASQICDDVNEAEWVVAMFEELASLSGRQIQLDRKLFEDLSLPEMLGLAEKLARENGLPEIGRQQMAATLEFIRSAASMSYLPKNPRPLPILVFAASETLLRQDSLQLPPELKRPELGWQDYSRGPVTQFTLDATHHSVLQEPTVNLIGQTWMQKIRES